METTKKVMTAYGRLVVGNDVYILLRPVPFDPEHYMGNTDNFWVAYVDDTLRGIDVYDPHTLSIAGDYHIDWHKHPKDVEVRVSATDEAEELEEPFEITNEFRPIDRIMEDELTWIEE